jgi:MFS family permease
MFNTIDSFIRENAPPWYRTPLVQTAVLGFIFFWVFAAYTTVQFYAASIYGSDLAADGVSAIYLTFTLTCLISPGIINKWGCRRAMFYGVLGYASLVIASLLYFLYGGSIWTRSLVVIGGAVLGFAASTLWTAQGRLILQYASISETIGEASIKSKKTTQSGKLLGMFWAIFQCSSLVGGLISFLYYNSKPQGSTALYLLFLGFILIGALFTQILLPPEIVLMTVTEGATNTNKDGKQTNTELTPLTADTNAEISSGATPNESCFNAELSDQSWTEESLGTLKLFRTQRMICLCPLFFYTVSEKNRILTLFWWLGPFPE